MVGVAPQARRSTRFVASSEEDNRAPSQGVQYRWTRAAVFQASRIVGPLHPSLETRIGNVEVDRPVGTRGEFRSGEPGAWPSRTFPATYFAEVLPEFPSEALEADLTSVVVRVDFRIGRDGLAHDARARVPEGTPLAEQFAAASEAVLPRWRFTPTWRLAAEGEEEPLVLMETSAFLAFRFDIEVWRDGGKVEVEFGH